MSYELPTTLVGLAGLAVLVLGGLLKIRVQQLAQFKKVTEVHEQVQNAHSGSNLREDIDRIDAVVRDTLARVIAQASDITLIRGGLNDAREDLRNERERAIAADEHITDALHEERKRSIIADADLSRRIDNARCEREL